MELWYYEQQNDTVRFQIKVEKQLYSHRSPYQQIDIFESVEFGRFLTLDGVMMMSEKDEFIYHEMMVHVPMLTHPKPERVLVIGAGDGGIVKELIKYDSLQQIDVVEIDEAVVEACSVYLPNTASSFDDPRVQLFYQDGMRFVRRIEAAYDLIIVDSTDPFGPGEGLFTKEFYGACYHGLKTDGILVNQHESPFYAEDAKMVGRIHQRLYDIFPISRVYQAHIPTYPSGHWLFGFSSKQYHPLEDFDGDRLAKLNIQTHYYNRQLHHGAFALPNYVEELLENVEA